jgi:ferrochelatase
MASNPQIGVLLMAYGSPDNVDDLETYLLDIRGGRPTSPELVNEIRERYIEIGGRSPLLDLTKEQACALQRRLNAHPSGRDATFTTYVGMRHWQPRIRDAVAAMAEDGIRQAVALVMAPHSSRLSTGAYFARLDEALAELNAPVEFQRVEDWHDHPLFIEALAANVALGQALFPDGSPYIVFSAHSLPERILALGDPYDRQLKHTAALVAQASGLPEGRWQFCFQSAGQSAEVWLGPPIEQVIVELAQAGETQVLVAPVGFVCDHVEILYDLDIAARRLAAQHGIRLERIPSLNAGSKFIQALADLVVSRLPALRLEA